MKQGDMLWNHSGSTKAHGERRERIIMTHMETCYKAYKSGLQSMVRKHLVSAGRWMGSKSTEMQFSFATVNELNTTETQIGNLTDILVEVFPPHHM